MQSNIADIFNIKRANVQPNVADIVKTLSKARLILFDKHVDCKLRWLEFQSKP